MISLTIGLALAVSIAIGRVRKINIGLVAIPFAYIIGAFFMHMKPSDVIDLWPSHIFFAILAISLFFGFAMANGTLAEIANSKRVTFDDITTLLLGRPLTTARCGITSTRQMVGTRSQS